MDIQANVLGDCQHNNLSLYSCCKLPFCRIRNAGIYVVYSHLIPKSAANIRQSSTPETYKANDGIKKLRRYIETLEHKAPISHPKRLSQNNLLVMLGQTKAEVEYNPYLGSYLHSISHTETSQTPINLLKTSQARRWDICKSWTQNTAKEIIKNCKNNAVSFPIPNSGARLEFYRHERGRIKPFACLGYSAPSGCGFGSCT